MTERCRRRLSLCSASLAAVLWTSAASADSAAAPAPSGATTDTGSSTSAAPAGGPFGALSGLGSGSNLFGDMGGLRPALAKFGVTLTLQEQSEVLGNLSGGRRQGFEYDGQTTGTLQMDTQKAFGWNGGLFNVSGLQIHGRNLSTDDLLVLQSVSNIEADPATRLWELWYQQKLFDDKIDIKVGQQSIDQEFILSQNSGVFLNSSMAWTQLPASDMPGGGPVSPLSALGVRLHAQPTDSISLLGGVFNGSPSPSNVGDPQKRNPNGLSFPLNGGVLAIAELQYAYPPQGAPGADTALTRSYKIGAWYDSEKFSDLRADTMGLSLADPASDGVAAARRGDFAFYGVVDQMLYRFENDPGRNIDLFVKPTFTPLQDRNLVNFSLNGGLTMQEPFVGRAKDVFGVGAGYARISDSASAFDQDRAFFNPGVYSPVRRSETFIEATYQYQATDWWQIQPDFQYIFNPGAGVANPDNPAQKVKNEAVIGARTTITF